MAFEDILYEVDGDGVATLTINRPERMNALRPQTTGELREAIALARDDDAVRCLLVTGAGPIGLFAVFAIPGAWILMRLTRRRGGMGEPAAVPLALLVVASLQLAFAPFANVVTRRMESEADWKALEVTENPAGLERLMVGLSSTSLGDPDPPEWSQILFGTHPALADRVAMARAWAQRENG